MKVLTYGILLCTLILCLLFIDLFIFLGPNLHSIMYVQVGSWFNVCTSSSYCSSYVHSEVSYEKVMEPWTLTSMPVELRMSEMTHLLETVLLVKRLCWYFQHDRVPPSFNCAVIMYLSHRFPGRWTGRGGPQRWTPTYPELKLLRLLSLGISEKCLAPA